MKCRLRQVIVFLLLGAIVNVAIAWGLVPLVDFSNTFSTADSAERINEGGLVIAWRAAQRGSTVFTLSRSPFISTADTPLKNSIIDPAQIIPLWSGFFDPLPESLFNTTLHDCRIGDARGWPMLCPLERTESMHREFQG